MPLKSMFLGGLPAVAALAALAQTKNVDPLYLNVRFLAKPAAHAEF